MFLEGRGEGCYNDIHAVLTSVVVLSTSQRYTVIVWWLWPVVQNLHIEESREMVVCLIDASCRNHALFTKFSRFDSRKALKMCVTQTHTHMAHTYRPLPSSVWAVSGDQEKWDTPTPSPHSSEKTVERDRESSRLPTDDESCVCVCVCVCVGGGSYVFIKTIHFQKTTKVWCLVS